MDAFLEPARRVHRKIRKHFKQIREGIAAPIRCRISQTHVGYLAVVAIFRDEGPYLQEWLEFHRKAGVDHFFLFDNGSVDNGRDILADYPASVTVRDWDGSQPGAYQRAVIDYGFGYRWMMFIDLDEFVFPSKAATIPQVLRGMETEDLVLLPWRVFGTGGLDDRDRTSSVVGTFRRCIDYRSGNLLPSRAMKTKAIANPRAMRRASTHWPEMRRGSAPAVWSNGGATTDKEDAYRESNRLFLHHYMSKSRKEFEEIKSRNREFRQSLGRPYSLSLNDEVVATADSEESGVENISAVQFLDRHSRTEPARS